MKNNEQTRKDWRDSLVTKVLAWTAVGALAFGSMKGWEYADKKFDEKYGWLKNQPTEVQLEYANRTFDESPRRESLREYHVKTFLKAIND